MRHSLKIAATSLLFAACVPVHSDGVDWRAAEAAFEHGKTAEFANADPSRAGCAGYWFLHADAVDDGAIPAEAMKLLDPALGKIPALINAQKHGIEWGNSSTYRAGADKAEQQLRAALGGDDKALRRYFRTLGRCMD